MAEPFDKKTREFRGFFIADGTPYTSLTFHIRPSASRDSRVIAQ